MISKKTICAIIRYQKQNSNLGTLPLGTKLVVNTRNHMGKLRAAKRVVSVCRNLNLLQNTTRVNLSIVGTYRFTQNYSEESVINIIFNQKHQSPCYSAFLIRSDLFKQSGHIKTLHLKHLFAKRG